MQVCGVLGAALHRGKNLGAHRMEGCVGVGAGLDVSEDKNFMPLPGVEPKVRVVKLAIMQCSPFPCYLSLRRKHLPLQPVL